jgi:hypothetical protein
VRREADGRVYLRAWDEFDRHSAADTRPRWRLDAGSGFSLF